MNHAPLGFLPPPCVLALLLASANATAGLSATGCVDLADFAARHHATVSIADSANDENYFLHFDYTDRNGQRKATLTLPLDVRDGAVGGNEYVCGGNVIISNIEAERGGTLAIGRLTAKGFALSSHTYMSSDEDTAELDFREGALLVSTSTDGTRRLLPSQDGTLQAERISCQLGTDAAPQSLTLTVDTDGGVRAFSYAASTSQYGGGMRHCTVDASQLDPTGHIRWDNKENHAVRVSYDDAHPNADGEPRPTTIHLTRDEGIYTFEFEHLQQSTFCPPSVELAQRIRLQKGNDTCIDMTFF